MGGDHAVSGLLGADPAGDPHDPRDREPEQHGAPGGDTRGHLPNDRAAAKLIYLACRVVACKWKNPLKRWQEARAEFSIRFGERFWRVASRTRAVPAPARCSNSTAANRYN